MSSYLEIWTISRYGIILILIIINNTTTYKLLIFNIPVCTQLHFFFLQFPSFSNYLTIPWLLPELRSADLNHVGFFFRPSLHTLCSPSYIHVPWILSLSCLFRSLWPLYSSIKHTQQIPHACESELCVNFMPIHKEQAQ